MSDPTQWRVLENALGFGVWGRRSGFAFNRQLVVGWNLHSEGGFGNRNKLFDYQVQPEANGPPPFLLMQRFQDLDYAEYMCRNSWSISTVSSVGLRFGSEYFYSSRL